MVAEALTNIANSQVRHAVVSVRRLDGRLHLRVVDDGWDGANESGSGVVCISRRVAAHDGSFSAGQSYRRTEPSST
ncbi:hypothetical protein GCM10020216_031550 [Nonomuraea helvata]